MIRASLPRTEGQAPPTRPNPEFTIRQPNNNRQNRFRPRHGGGRGRLRLWRQDGSIYCEVSDEGPGIADTDAAGMQQVPLSTEGGRGLWVVRQFTDEVRFTGRDPGIVVTVKIQL